MKWEPIKDAPYNEMVLVHVPDNELTPKVVNADYSIGYKFRVRTASTKPGREFNDLWVIGGHFADDGAGKPVAFCRIERIDTNSKE